LSVSPETSPKARIYSLDLLKGIVMVIMMLEAGAPGGPSGFVQKADDY
jgi:hypothetical protein